LYTPEALHNSEMEPGLGMKLARPGLVGGAQLRRALWRVAVRRR
jgi:hypothetical protein